MNVPVRVFARKFLPEYARCLEFVNEDLIAGGISPFAPEKAAIHGGSIQLALQRIKTRVRNGGQDVPEGVVRRRFGRSLGNFFNYYQPLAESWTIFDNSGETPKMIAFEESGKREVLDPVLFNLLLKHRKK